MKPENNNLAAAIHLLVFESGIPDTPLFVKATGFIVGYERRVFFVTARHTLIPYIEHPLSICSPTGHVLPLLDVYFVPETDVDFDFTDLAIVEVDIQRIKTEHQETKAIQMEMVMGDWKKIAQVYGCFAIGFPNAHACVDYDTGVVEMGVVEVTGSYHGDAQAPCLHEFKVEEGVQLDSFSGLSGSPVFCRNLVANGCKEVMLCGVAIQGTSESRIVRFIDASVLKNMLELKCTKQP